MRSSITRRVLNGLLLGASLAVAPLTFAQTFAYTGNLQHDRHITPQGFYPEVRY